MPILNKSPYSATVTWLGVNTSLDVNLQSQSKPSVTVSLDGFEGEGHGGPTRPSCSRVTMLHERGTDIRNFRQLSVLSAEELAQIAAEMDLPDLDPGLVGANMVLTGIPDLSHLPPASRMQSPDGTTLFVEMENRPCRFPGEQIDAVHPGHGDRFKAAAKEKRGIMACVERGGTLSVGDALTLYLPAQRAWTG